DMDVVAPLFCSFAVDDDAAMTSLSSPSTFSLRWNALRRTTTWMSSLRYKLAPGTEIRAGGVSYNNVGCLT
ncbi:MAG: hypothetical protein K2L75_08585, partial [Muribaculaceae bacterium]|nr:hypothetical protein [Muribaculaceae bacterium]